MTLEGCVSQTGRKIDGPHGDHEAYANQTHEKGEQKKGGIQVEKRKG